MASEPPEAATAAEIDLDVLAETFPPNEGDDDLPNKPTAAARERAEAHYESANTREELIAFLAAELDEYAGEAVRARDAQWRDALRGNSGEEFWRTSGPQNPKQAAIHEHESSRVDGVWRDWMVSERDKLRDLLKTLLGAAQNVLDKADPGSERLRQVVDATRQAMTRDQDEEDEDVN